ncbi:unnamed protein product [Schistosoma bovis]|nr:unnamed protein product [Schistosoma bovis]
MTNDSEFNFTATASIWISELRGVFELFTKMSADAGATNVANGGTPQPRPQNKRLQQTQAQVDEVVDIMRVNMEKVLERDAKLSQLDDRAGRLRTIDLMCLHFTVPSHTLLLRNKIWCSLPLSVNCKYVALQEKN